MYYQELIERFWCLNENTRLGSNAIAMYLYLLKLGNENNSYKVIVSDVAISATLGFTRKTVKTTKERLRSYGLIQYKTKNGLPCSYRLLLNYNLNIEIVEETPEKLQPESESFIEEKVEFFPSEAISSDVLPTDTLQITELIKPTVPSQSEDSNNPTLDEFIEYAKTLDSYKAELDSGIKEKYIIWQKNNWLNNFGRPIKNWKSSLKSVLPYLSNNLNAENASYEIPIIKRPKSP
ncbi:transcriptional regulator [Chryseobacterium manosquense]|uniref:Transcriptional regulator n=1 Tax=Chryseobacterium manosquense TaxID=2754694 RepID=A0A7H1DXG3_9FLAO|nr:transcriptional regulator [Chryseobacterium manosquense]QNS41671.1 transcriptional regulator [Chryseobacterium manosquense]